MNNYLYRLLQLANIHVSATLNDRIRFMCIRKIPCTVTERSRSVDKIETIKSPFQRKLKRAF